MRGQDSKKSRPEVRIEYTRKPVSGWGGLILFGQFFERLGLRELLVRALPDGRTSPNQVAVADIAIQLMATVLTGGSRFAHAARVAADPVLKTILGADRFGDPMTLTRYFGAFRRSDSEQLQRCISEITTHLLLRDRSSDVLDLDSTVFSRCGEQEGAERGYNPSRRGRQSHQPLLGVLAEAKCVLRAWLRSGKASTFRGASEFYSELMAALPDGFSIRAVRADSGFGSTEFIKTLETHGTPYAIALRMSRPIQRWAAGLSGWKQATGLDQAQIAEGMFDAPYWDRPRRVVVMRKKIFTRPKGMLFDVPAWDYYALVTTCEMSGPDTWRFYNRRGDCENRIKELKYDFNADGFCLRNFYGTEAVLRLNCLLFNLVSEFKQRVLHDGSITLSTIRTNVLVVGAILGACARTTILRLGLVKRWQTAFQALLTRVAELTFSTVAHLQRLIDQDLLDTPSPWRARQPSPLYFARKIVPN